MQKVHSNPDPISNRGQLDAIEFITQEIANSPQQRVPFSEFMNWVLYHPQYGYYTRRRQKIGAKGDFFTSPHLASDFGELVAVQLVEMWEALGKPTPFTIVEMGAGQGLLASDILRYLEQQSKLPSDRDYAGCYVAIEYQIVEKAAAHIAEQRYRLQHWLESGVSITWCSLADIPFHSVTGCFLSNELVDAFPVHCVTVKDQQLKEIYVTAEPTQFSEAIADCSTSKLLEYFHTIGIDITHYTDGYRTEVNLAALEWMQAVAERLRRGYVLTIDYGYPAERYYSPLRSQGTLQCYYQHSYHNDPYVFVGEQDITAHVDFTALQRQGERSGLETLGLTQQGLFLMALGLGDRLTALTQTEAKTPQDLQERLSQRDALHQLINPMGLGGFYVLIQGKRLQSKTERAISGLKTGL